MCKTYKDQLADFNKKFAKKYPNGSYEYEMKNFISYCNLQMPNGIQGFLTSKHIFSSSQICSIVGKRRKFNTEMKYSELKLIFSTKEYEDKYSSYSLEQIRIKVKDLTTEEKEKKRLIEEERLANFKLKLESMEITYKDFMSLWVDYMNLSFSDKSSLDEN